MIFASAHNIFDDDAAPLGASLDRHTANNLHTLHQLRARNPCPNGPTPTGISHHDSDRSTENTQRIGKFTAGKSCASRATLTRYLNYFVVRKSCSDLAALRANRTDDFLFQLLCLLYRDTTSICKVGPVSSWVGILISSISPD